MHMRTGTPAQHSYTGDIPATAEVAARCQSARVLDGNRRTHRVMDELSNTLARSTRNIRARSWHGPKFLTVLFTLVPLAFPLLAHSGSRDADEALRLEAALLKRDLGVLEAQAEKTWDLILHFGQDANRAADGGPETTAGFKVQSVALRIDDREILNRTYTDKESEALRRGGVDRLTAAGIGAGSHRLDVIVQGRDSDGQMISRSGRIDFTRGTSAARVQVFFTSQQDTALRVTLME